MRAGPLELRSGEGNDEMDVRSKIREWLLEDFGEAPLHFKTGEDSWCEAEVRAKSEGVLAGSPFFAPVFEETQDLLALDRGNLPEIEWKKKEGESIRAGEVLAAVRGYSQTLRKAERTALNVLSHMSEIATHTAGLLRCLGEFPPTFRGIIDTRKNRPGLRYFEKYAVRTGGAKNHRLGFFDGDLIKDNDIAAAGSIPLAIDEKWGGRYMVDVQIEVQNLEELAAVLEDGRVNMILLDNMDIETLRTAVAHVRERGAASKSGKPYILEASGVKGTDFRAIAQTGVDYISSSALVRAAPPLDFHMKIVRVHT